MATAATAATDVPVAPKRDAGAVADSWEDEETSADPWQDESKDPWVQGSKSKAKSSKDKKVRKEQTISCWEHTIGPGL